MRAVLALLVFALMSGAQTPPAPLPSQNPGDVYICPMDPDVRSNSPGKCARCGMELKAGLPDPVEYHMHLDVTPRPVKPGQPANLTFEIHDPWKDRPVTKFQTVHEKLFHMFVVSQDLEVFLHNHPTLGSDGKFHYDYPSRNRNVPGPGRFLSRWRDAAINRQSPLRVRAGAEAASLTRDYYPKTRKTWRWNS